MSHDRASPQRILPFRPTRRWFCAGLGAAGLAPLLGCSGNDAGFPTPRPGDTFFTLDHVLPQTQSADQLATWLETPHPEHSIDGWFFFGSLEDEQHPDDPASFFAAYQRLGIVKMADGRDAAGLGIGFNQKSRDRYEYTITDHAVPSPDVVIQSNPWSVALHLPGRSEAYFTVRALSGRVGALGTVYQLDADVPADAGRTPLSGRLQTQVRFRDDFGVINQGYGTAAFSPQYLMPEQQRQVKGVHGGSVQAYLEASGDPMINQGSFYYQLPFLTVEDHSTSVGGVLRTRGKKGLLWADFLAQTHDAQSAWAVVQEVVYEFFAIQFPREDLALMIVRVKGRTGELHVARLHGYDSRRTRNGGRPPLYSWPMDGIRIDPDPDPANVFVGEVSGKRYPLVQRVRLASDEMSADLTVRMSIRNQELQENPTLWEYEGLGTVEGTLNGRSVTGQAFLEVVPLAGT